MTYCVGILVRDGLVMIADTRTNAGVDNISTYRKLHTIEEDNDRLVFAASAGNLSVTQLALSMLKEGLEPLEEGGARRFTTGAATMFAVAQLFSEAVRMASEQLSEELEARSIPASVSFLLGGRLASGPLILYYVYDAGNFIECRPDTPFLQIGESKYGKPILDRALNFETPLEEAVKVALISFDSTLRSNLAVGRPLDMIVIARDRVHAVVKRRIGTDDRYFNDLSARWSMLLTEARATIPDPPFMADFVAINGK
jgi:putative proteasome-type protease